MDSEAALVQTLRPWRRVFGERRGQTTPVSQIALGPSDNAPEVVEFLVGAGLCEKLGWLTLSEKAGAITDPELAALLAEHAEEARVVWKALQSLVGTRAKPRPTAALRVAARIIGWPRPLPDQAVTTLLVEASAIAVYRTVADSLPGGRVVETLRVVIDDHRLHVNFMRDLIAVLAADLSEPRRFALRSLRRAVTGLILALHAVAHRRYLMKLAGVDAATVRGALLNEQQRAFEGLPGLENPLEAEAT